MIRRQRLVYICADRGIPVGGHTGSSVHMRGLAAALARLEFDVTLLAARTGGDDLIPGVSIEPLSKESLSLRISQAIQAKGGPEKGRVFLDLVRNMELSRKLDRLHRESPTDAVLERMSLFSFAGLQFARRRNIPYLLEVNAPLTDEHKRHRRMELEDFASAIEAILLAEADRVVAVSSAIRNYAVSCGTKPGHIAVLPNAAGETFRTVCSEPASPRCSFVVGFVGSLKPWHGLQDLLDAFRLLLKDVPEAKLLIVGDGPERPALESKSRRTGIGDKVEWTGPVKHEEVPGLLCRMDVAVAPYPAIAGFYFSPLKIAEYMALGRAIVASRVGQVAEILKNKKTALLYEPGDIAGLVKCFKLLHSDPRLRRELGERARESSKDMTWGHNARVIHDLVRSAIEELRR
ncbi:MAG: glycosyltransferase family 4 protein [Acidobacteriota bacterium]